MTRHGALLLSLPLFVACGDDASPFDGGRMMPDAPMFDAAADTGPGDSDAGPLVDAGPGRDAGPDIDSGPVPPGLDAPTGLEAVAGNALVMLSWTDASAGESTFVVYASDNGMTFARVGEVEANATGFVAAGLENEVEYSFHVRATDGSALGPASETVRATPVGEVTEGALYADQGVGPCADYDAATRACGAGESEVFPKLLDAMRALGPGDTLYVRGGETIDDGDALWTTSISEHAGLNPQTPGTAAAPIHVSVYPGEAVLIEGPNSRDGIRLENASHYVINGFVLRRFNKATEGFGPKENITLTNMEFYNMRETGMRLREINGLSMRNIYVHHTAESGISIRSAQNVLIENSRSSHNDDGRGADGDADGLHTIDVDGLVVNGFIAEANSEDGIDLHSSGTLTNVIARNNAVVNLKLWRRAPDDYAPRHMDIYNSLFYGAGEAGIKLSVGATANIRNCVIFDAAEEGIAFRAATGLPDRFAGMDNVSRVENTIIARTGYGAIEVRGAEGSHPVVVHARSNLYFDVPTSTRLPASDSAAVTGDPLFRDAAAGDFRLMDGSPAIDAGIETPFAFDFDGNARTGAWDIGAFER